MSNNHTSLAGEYAVASEISRMDHDAHLTYGNKKEADIIVHNGKSLLLVEVKSKEGGEWPWIRGIPDDGHHILVFVDFQGKELKERPDFYILTGSDWKMLVPNLEVIRNNKNYKGFDEKDNHTPTWINDKNRGVKINVRDVEEHKEKWEKLDNILAKLDNTENF